jgi:hypothetical protein
MAGGDYFSDVWDSTLEVDPSLIRAGPSAMFLSHDVQVPQAGGVGVMPSSSPVLPTEGVGAMPISPQVRQARGSGEASSAHQGIRDQELRDLINHPDEIQWRNILQKPHDTNQWKEAYSALVQNRDAKAKILLELICRQTRSWIYENRISGLSSMIKSQCRFCDDELMDLEVISFSRDQVQDWRWPQLYIKAVSNNEQQVLDFVAQMGQDYGKHPTLVSGMNYNELGTKTKEFEQKGLISELYRRTDFVRFDCQRGCDFSTIREMGANMCFEGVTLFRKSQEFGYDSCETTSKLDVLLPHVPSGPVTSDVE